MRRLPLIALLAVAGLVAGCSGATYDQAYGRPDATRWTYFEASPASVSESVEAWFSLNGWYLETSEPEENGVMLTFSPREGGAGIQSVRVERSADARFGARAQTIPRQRPLSRDLEMFISRRD